MNDLLAGGDMKEAVDHSTGNVPQRTSRRTYALLTLLALGWFCIPPRGSSWSQYNVRNPAYLIKAKSGAVASENILCSEIGVEVLKDGGNAVDSAIATTLCIGVVNMFS